MDNNPFRPQKRDVHHMQDLPMSSTSPKRQRMQDVDMMDVANIDSPKLHHLPHQVLKLIMAKITGSAPLDLAKLASYLPLRAVCTSFRAAFDAQVTNLIIPLTESNGQFIEQIMPRFNNLHTLTLHRLQPNLPFDQHFGAYFSKTNARIRTLTYMTPHEIMSPHEPLADVLSACFSKYLESLSTTSLPLLVAMAIAKAPIRELWVLMNDVDPNVLRGYQKLRRVCLLYRDTTALRMCGVAQSLRYCTLLERVEVRVHGMSTTSLDWLQDVPRLKKVNLFGCTVEGRHRLEVLGRCKELEEVGFDWMKGFSGKDLAAFAKSIGERLQKIFMRNCEQVDDAGLYVLAKRCQRCEVELRFVREQFSPHVLALFDQRISWYNTT